MQFHRLIQGTLCSALLSSLLVAQGSGTSGSNRERIEQEIENQQRLMREGRIVRSNVRVTLRLRNGSRLRGVVRDGRFVERPQGLEFLASDMGQEGAGIRLWYFDETNSFMFLPYSTIAYHKIGDRLSDEEVRKIAASLDRLQAERARTKEDPNAKPAEPSKDKPEAADPNLPTLTAEQKELLAEFPPDEGWSYDRMRELEARKIRIGVFPNEKEQRFLDNFGAWSQAHQTWQQIEEIKAASQRPQTPPAPGGETKGSGDDPAPGIPKGLPSPLKKPTPPGGGPTRR
jgi:hypothetical protein